MRAAFWVMRNGEAVSVIMNTRWSKPGAIKARSPGS